MEFWSKKSRKDSILNGNLKEALRKATELEHMDSVDDYETYEREALSDDWDDSFDESLEESFNESMEAEGLEDYEIESLTKAQKRRVARRMAKKRGRKGGVFAARRFGSRGMTGKQMKGVVGLLTIVITRNSYNIPYDLPVEVFNSLDSLCNSPIVRKYIPNPDVQFLGGYVDATFTNFVYRFRQISTGALDNVTVSCQEVSYVKLIVGLQTDMFQVGGGTIRISDELKQSQFDKQINFVNQNILGKEMNNPLSTGSFITPDTFKKDTAYLKVAFPVDKQNGFVFMSAYYSGTPVGYQLQTTFFLSLSYVNITGYKGGFKKLS